jgi:hypothetical protein
MTLGTIIVLLPIQLAGLASLAYGVIQVQWLVGLHRQCVKIRADRLPDDQHRTLRGLTVYRRVARFQCPLLRKTRYIAESVGSGTGSPWAPGESIPVIVSTQPPHAAVVATFSNLYLLPLVCLVIGIMAALVLPVAILLKR